MSDIANHNGKFILNGVERPTVPITPTLESVQVIAEQKKKRNFVDLELTDNDELGVYTTDKQILLGVLGDTTEDVYGDVLRQVIESGVTPTVEATTELINDRPFVWLHFRQDAKELVWDRFAPRRSPEAQAFHDRTEEAIRKAEDAVMQSRQNREDLQLRSLALNEYNTARKQPPIAWLLWLFFGLIGAHRFYFGDNKQGVMMIIATACFVVPGAIWALVDALKINGRLREFNTSVWAEIATRNGIPSEPMPKDAAR